MRTLKMCLVLKTGGDVGFEVLFLDNTRDGRHRASAEQAFAADGHAGVSRLYVGVPEPGKAAAQNAGIRRARGSVLVFLDDDVLPDPDLILEYDKAFASHDCAAVQGRVTLEFEGEPPPSWLNRRLRLDLAEMDFPESVIPFEMGLTGANMAVRAGMFKRYGAFDERLGPGRSGTLADQEFSERLRRHGERQLYWRAAHVAHVIPRARLTLRSFARTYADVGRSDVLLSDHFIQGGKARFTGYMAKRCILDVCRTVAACVRRDRGNTVCGLCRTVRHVHYWRQALSTHWT